MRDPLINKKYASSVSTLPLKERLKVEAEAKQAKLKRLKDNWVTQQEREEEEALAVRDAKSGKKDNAEDIVARQKAREKAHKKNGNETKNLLRGRQSMMK